MLIFLFGEDSFRSSRKLKEIKNKFLEKDPIGSGLSVFNADDFKVDMGQAQSALATNNLLAPKRLVIIKNIIAQGSENQKENLALFLKNQKWIINDKDTVAVFWEAGKIKKSEALYKLLAKSAKMQNFEKLAGVKLEQWALGRLKELGENSTISQSALEKLLAYAGENMHLLDSEIQKLAAYASGKMITEENVELLVRANLSNNIFNTIDAIGARDKKKALSLLHQHLEKGEDPFYLLSMLVYQFRNLLKVADLKNRLGANEYAIARESKMHPFVVKKSLAQIREYTLAGQAFEKLKSIYQILGEMDTAAKTGKIEIKLALDKFIVEL